MPAVYYQPPPAMLGRAGTLEVFMRRPVEACTFRLREKASVFLAELHPAPGGTDRTRILSLLRKREHDATHHCSAWREGLPVRAWGADDDGEPSGSAGRPMLKVLEGRGLTDCLAVCVRWFGGTKLGTGGLQRAYSQALLGAVAAAEAAGSLEALRILRIGLIRVPPEQAHLSFALLGAFPEVELLGQDFGPEQAEIRFSLPPDSAGALEEAWRDRSRGGSVSWEP